MMCLVTQASPEHKGCFSSHVLMLAKEFAINSVWACTDNVVSVCACAHTYIAVATSCSYMYYMCASVCACTHTYIHWWQLVVVICIICVHLCKLVFCVYTFVG